MFSSVQTRRVNVDKNRGKCELLEENVIFPFSVILNEASLPETLELTEDRQYRNRGLVHISGKAFQFICELE